METAINFFSDPTAYKLLMPIVHKAKELLVSVKNISPVMPKENRAIRIAEFLSKSSPVLS